MNDSYEPILFIESIFYIKFSYWNRIVFLTFLKFLLTISIPRRIGWVTMYQQYFLQLFPKDDDDDDDFEVAIKKFTWLNNQSVRATWISMKLIMPSFFLSYFLPLVFNALCQGPTRILWFFCWTQQKKVYFLRASVCVRSCACAYIQWKIEGKK